MACEHPTEILNPRYKDMKPYELSRYSLETYGIRDPPNLYVVVPCGYCQGCQKSRLNQFRLRLLFECEKSVNNIFITCTFSEENLAKFIDYPNRAVKLFLDRARKYYGKQLRHWFVPEYGTLHGRIHYHGILFNFPEKSDFEELKKLWSYGHIYLGYVNEKTCSYICKYLTKDYNPDKPAPRIISSKGIGSSYLTKSRIAVHKQQGNLKPYLEINGMRQALPRYWYNKIFDDNDKIEIQRQLMQQPLSYNLDGKEYDNPIDFGLARHQKSLRNIRLGLSPSKKPKTNKKLSSFDKFKKRLQNEYTIENPTEL